MQPQNSSCKRRDFNVRQDLYSERVQEEGDEEGWDLDDIQAVEDSPPLLKPPLPPFPSPPSLPPPSSYPSLPTLQLYLFTRISFPLVKPSQYSPHQPTSTSTALILLPPVQLPPSTLPISPNTLSGRMSSSWETTVFANGHLA